MPGRFPSSPFNRLTFPPDRRAFHLTSERERVEFFIFKSLAARLMNKGAEKRMFAQSNMENSCCVLDLSN